MWGRALAIGLTALSLTCTAVPLSAETLAEAIALAYRTNPTLASGRYDVRAADEGLVQARSELRPTASVEVTGDFERTVEGRASRTSNPFTPDTFNQNSDQAQFVVQQPLYTGGRATADRAAAEAGVRSARETLRGTEGDLLLAVITAYVDVRRYEATLQVWQHSVGDLDALTTEIEARQVAGELTKTDIAQAQSQLEIAREQVVATEESLESSRADYAALVGQDAGVLAGEPPLPQLPRDIAMAYDLAEQHSPELAGARYAEIGSRQQIVSAKAAGRPTVSLRGSATLSGEAIPYHLYNQDKDFSGSVVLSLPLSAGGLTASQIREAEDRNSGDRLKIEEARRTLVRNITDAWNQAVTAQRTLTLLDRQNKAAAIQLDGMTAEYRVGLRSTFDVLYAEQSLRDAEVSLLSARRDRYVSEATLLRQTGLLEADAILTGVQLYDPAQHLRQVEHKNALPWDGSVAAIDRLGAPTAHQKMIEQPGVAAEQPMVSTSGASFPDDAPLARSAPETPIAGTVGQPARSARQGQH